MSVSLNDTYATVGADWIENQHNCLSERSRSALCDLIPYSQGGVAPVANHLKRHHPAGIIDSEQCMETLPAWHAETMQLRAGV
jgi:hypothetical protein